MPNWSEWGQGSPSAATSVELAASPGPSASASQAVWVTDLLALFRFVPGDVTPPDGLTCIAPTGGVAGRWLIQGVRGSLGYGAVYNHDGVGSQILAVVGTYYSVAGQMPNNGPSYNCTVAAGQVRVRAAGDYTVLWGLSFSGTAAAFYEFAIFVDGGHQDQGEANQRIGTGVDVQSVTGPAAILTVPANAVIEMRASSQTAGAVLAIRQGTLAVSWNR